MAHSLYANHDDTRGVTQGRSSTSPEPVLNYLLSPHVVTQSQVADSLLLSTLVDLTVAHVRQSQRARLRVAVHPPFWAAT